MSDPGLQGLARSDFIRDHAITYSDMIGLFAKAESESSTLTSAEVQSLQALVTGAATLNMPGYVQNLAYKTGDPANATYLLGGSSTILRISLKA
jgi:hypothetical protein